MNTQHNKYNTEGAGAKKKFQQLNPDGPEQIQTMKSQPTPQKTSVKHLYLAVTLFWR